LFAFVAVDVVRVSRGCEDGRGARHEVRVQKCCLGKSKKASGELDFRPLRLELFELALTRLTGIYVIKALTPPRIHL
jgi:hypothetical protein